MVVVVVVVVIWQRKLAAFGTVQKDFPYRRPFKDVNQQLLRGSMRPQRRLNLPSSIFLYLEAPVKPFMSATPKPKVLQSSPSVRSDKGHRFPLPRDGTLLR